ncbi:hypothetical protein [Nocardioides sp. cx-173]|uniref:hypothetical protein n=1 Tax=Nocardioides sp. cx-173 TaxID=2898796 RepID=UPI001E5436D0|nr:hypothetical protein [Nocardioides sp. cx-173]MCD4525584.1 hypothetical protein [Nocardioides sp. cx-173]UGB42728.1 hypothetical protein LQ940_04175 [Nocardioides sp. cx-173]
MRALAAVGLLVAGAATAVASVALHQAWWGLLLAVLATTAALLALPAGWWSRTAYGVGWAAMAGYLSVPRDRGGYLISSDVNGYLLLALGLLVTVVSVATLPRPARADAGQGPPAS